MPRRVLLISANRCVTPDPVFPLGLACLNAALRQARHETVWLDQLVDAGSLETVLESYRPNLVGISVRNIDDVLIRTQETFFDDAVSLIARIRQRINCPIIVGGSGFSLFPQQLLELTGADYGICGEGENALLSLIAALDAEGDVSAVPGCVFRQNGGIVVNPVEVSPRGGTLEEVDRPAALTTHYLQSSGTLNLQTQRGCRFRCCYCTYPLVEGRRHRRREPEAVAAELEQLQRLGARYVCVVDSIFNSSPAHVTETCEAILRRNAKVSWGCFLRPQGLSPELMKLMARAGLKHAEFGSDSFCDEVLQAYQKDITFEDILTSSELARREGVGVCHFIISGGPGETEATLRTSFRNSQRLSDAVIMAVAGMRIYPGTSLFARAVAEGRVQPHTDFLHPTYYFAPGLTEESVRADLQEFAQLPPNWIIGDPPPAYRNLVERLRHRGIVGPLWGYFSMLQRLGPLVGTGGVPA